MFDKVVFAIEEDVKTTGLDSWEETVDQKTGEVKAKGRLRNLRLNQRGNLTVITGSLAKFRLGDNFQTLTRKETELAVEELSDISGLLMNKAQIWNFEVAQNFLMKRPVSMYTSLLLSAPHLKRSIFKDGEGVLFGNKSRAALVYDKIAEQKAKGRPIPDMYRGKHLLRYENRHLKRVSRQFRMNKIFGSTLYEENFYVKALTEWKEQFFLIQKTKIERTFDMENIKSFERSLMSLGLEKAGGLQVALAKADSARKEGRLNKSKYYRIRNRMKAIAGQKIAPQDSAEADLMYELEGKIKMAAMCCR